MNETLAKQKVTPKKMNATNSRGLNAVKQKIKKASKEHQKDIDSFRADKDAYMESEDEEVVAPKQKKAKPSAAQDVAADDDDEGWGTVGKGGRTLQFTPESILKHLRTILESRGKKNTDRNEQIKIMEKLYEVAATPYQRIRVLLTIISTRFDMTTGTQTFMSQEQWKAAEKEFGTLLSVLETSREYVVVETAEPWEDDEKLPTVAEGGKFAIPGSVVSYVERLDDELTRSLQHIDPHTAEYIERLSDESDLYNNIVRTMLYQEEISKDASLNEPQRSLNRVVMRRLEHVYFKVCNILFPHYNLYLFLYSHPQSSRFSMRTAGKQFLQSSTRPSHHAAPLKMPRPWSTFSATTSTSTLRVKDLLKQGPCFAKSISKLYMTTTTRLVI